MAVFSGSIIRDLDPYVVTYDETTRVWRILNTRHKSLEGMDLEEDIPDTSPALMIVSEGAFIQLIKAASELGIIENAALKHEERNTLETLEKLSEELRTDNIKLKLELEETKKENGKLEILARKPQRSESFELKNKVLDSMLKLAIVEDIKTMTINAT